MSQKNFKMLINTEKKFINPKNRQLRILIFFLPFSYVHVTSINTVKTLLQCGCIKYLNNFNVEQCGCIKLPNSLNVEQC